MPPVNLIAPTSLNEPTYPDTIKPSHTNPTTTPSRDAATAVFGHLGQYHLNILGQNHPLLSSREPAMAALEILLSTPSPTQTLPFTPLPQTKQASWVATMSKKGADQYKMWRLEQKERWKEEEVKRKDMKIKIQLTKTNLKKQKLSPKKTAVCRKL